MQKRITLQLNEASISKAITEVRAFEDEYKKALHQLYEKLVQEGVWLVKQKILAHGAYGGEFSTHKLYDSVMGWYDPQAGKGYITVFADNGDGFNYAQIVEFGSGVRGAEAGGSSEKDADWQYDVHHHGHKGWYFYWNGEWIKTRGQEPRPFMWEAYQELLTRVQGIANVDYYNIPSRYAGHKTDDRSDRMLEEIGYID